MRTRGWSIAELAGVTVRPLRHYDEIGLLRPIGRTAAGYRRYDYVDLERLQQILAYRELGFSLVDIAAVLDDPHTSVVDHLRAQHRHLTEQVDRLQQMVSAIEKTMEAHRMGISLDPKEMFEVFGDFDATRHVGEAEQRWGQTEAFRESQRRTAAYRKADWQRMKAESDEVVQRLAAALDSGLPAESPAAMDAAEKHRQHITRWFYGCGYEIHRGLAEMYVADPRFTAHYEERRPGLAQYVHDAISANADRAAAAA